MHEVIDDNVIPLQPLDDDAALAWLRVQPDGRTTLTAAALARRWGWPEHRARRRLDTWQKAGHIRRRGRVVTAVGESVGRTAPEPVRNGVGATVGNPAQPIDDPWKNNRSVRLAAQAAAQAVQLIEFPAIRRFAEQSDQQPDSTAPVGVMSQSPKAEPVPSPANHMLTPKRIAPAQPGRHSLSVADAMAYVVAAGLAGCAAWFSLKGLAVLFPGAPREIVVMGACMEIAKLVACGWLAGAWRQVPWIFRGVFMLLIAGLVVINAAGTFSQLTAAHVGNRAVTAAARTMRANDLDSRIEVAAGKIADLDRRIASIDGIIAGAAQRGRANAALSVMADQKKARAALVSERERESQALADLKVERGSVEARTRVDESEAAPIMYAAELIGVGADPERAIRWLIALLVCCLDPMALTLTAAVSARRST